MSAACSRPEAQVGRRIALGLAEGSGARPEKGRNVPSRLEACQRIRLQRRHSETARLPRSLCRFLDASTLTVGGWVPGTPAYMAPEQLWGRPDVGSDLHALGVILYELLIGHIGRTSATTLQNSVQRSSIRPQKRCAATTRPFRRSRGSRPYSPGEAALRPSGKRRKGRRSAGTSVWDCDLCTTATRTPATVRQ